MGASMTTPMSARLTSRAAACRSWRVGLGLLAALLLWAPPLAAQISSVGVNPALIGFPVRGSDAAYDPVNNVYLVVGAHGVVRGVFVNSAGSPVSAPFQISGGAGFAQFPRALYSPHVNNGAGGFLVTWHQGDGANLVNTRIVAYPNHVVTAQYPIPSAPTWWESGAAIAYSPSSRVFLVVWRDAAYVVTGVRIGLNGQAIGAPFAISAQVPGDGARDPNVAWNPHTNEFGVVYTGWNASGATTAFARVGAGGGVLSRNVFNVGPATYITDIAFNTTTGRYLAAWSQFGTYGAEIDASGNVVTKGLLSSTTGTYDGLGVAYNATSGTFLLVGHGPSFDVWAAELNSRGARTSADVSVTSAGGPIGSFYPRAAARSNAREWAIPFSHNFSMLRDQVVSTSSTGGGPAGSLGAASGGGTTTPPPPPPPSGGCTTPDPFASIGGGTCVNGGWVPSGTSGGSTGGCTTPSPGTGWTCVNGGWVPPTSSGSSGGCTTPDPFTAMGGGTCVNGGWIPGGSGSGGSTGGCTTPSPGTGWTCVNGGWLPPSGGSGGSTGGCTTPDPFTAIGGGTCVNGGWIPGSSGGCTTPPPGTGWTCVNGGWLPPSTGGSGGGSTGGCTTPDPFAAMGGGTCVNGGWIPGTTTSGSGILGGCTTPDPFASMGGGTCVNGGWTFGGSGTSSSGGCTTPDPFTAIGGGVCINGGWVPKSS